MNSIASRHLPEFIRRVRVEGMCIVAAAAVLAGAGFGDVAAHGQCAYDVTAIITPDDAEQCWPFPPSNTFAQGMNSKGEVVGYYVPCAIGNERAFYWSAETGFVTLPKPTNAVQAIATDINDHGVIIGQHSFSGVGFKGFVYDPETDEFTYLEPLHEGATATFLTVANAINNKNVIVGSRVISEPGVSPPISNAVIWDVNSGTVIDLGVMNGPTSTATSINDAGDVSGSTGPTLGSEGWARFDRTVHMLGPILGNYPKTTNLADRPCLQDATERKPGWLEPNEKLETCRQSGGCPTICGTPSFIRC